MVTIFGAWPTQYNPAPAKARKNVRAAARYSGARSSEPARACARVASTGGFSEAADMTVRSLHRAWNMRDFTVLTGHPVIAAISSHERSIR